jgi:hypothetical protein
MAMMEADKEARQRRKVGDIAYIMSWLRMNSDNINL